MRSKFPTFSDEGLGVSVKIMKVPVWAWLLSAAAILGPPLVAKEYVDRCSGLVCVWGDHAWAEKRAQAESLDDRLLAWKNRCLTEIQRVVGAGRQAAQRENLHFLISKKGEPTAAFVLQGKVHAVLDNQAPRLPKQDYELVIVYTDDDALCEDHTDMPVFYDDLHGLVALCLPFRYSITDDSLGEEYVTAKLRQYSSNIAQQSLIGLVH